MTEKYDIVLEQEQSTVVAKYETTVASPEAYQSEYELEHSMIQQLEGMGYEYAQISDEKGLIANLRVQLEKLNHYHFTENEWDRFFYGEIAAENLEIDDKTQIIQRDYIRLLHCDNGENRNIFLIDKRNIHNNYLQVINQYIPDGGIASNRYDVTILVNGLPLVHCELKRRGVSIKEAFNQINRYQRESFWAGKALFDYVQVFIISNGTHTKYYSNTTRFAKEQEDAQADHSRKVESNSFEFTSWWSDEQNKQLPDLRDFTATFLAKHTILNILTKYCVFTVDKNLMVMRPYQIAATEKILLRIQTAIYNKWQGTIRAGGYIWHTTGSGKTLTSFKTAQLATQIPNVDKVLFVVDRQDLDYQTMKEYDNFEKDCANSNANSSVLLRQLNNPNCNIIITTIQKLSTLLRKKAGKINVLDQNIVMIFDECHRSQFGEMHDIITRKFKRYLIFGFTGTPIFALNASKAGKTPYKTTAQAFGDQLHTYTIINAISDHNVLRFHVDYISTMKAKAQIMDTPVWGIEEESALHAPERISKIVTYILDHYAQKTKQQEFYAFNQTYNISQVVKSKNKTAELKNKVAMGGFNSILAVDSIDSAMAYYRELEKQIAERKSKLRIATIFTYAANEEENEMGYVLEEDPDSMEQLSDTAKTFLTHAIDRYNATYGTSYDVSGDQFGNYYKDISLRMKNRDIDLLIVVGMFLTGFDAKTLNTLWVDKNLKMHGLLQAYSRTNRILNTIKDSGNIICFRNLEKPTNDSFALFGDQNAGGIVIMRPFHDYYFGYEDEQGEYHHGYKELVEKLLAQFPTENLSTIISEKEQKEFIRQFSAILRAQNMLSSFDQYCPEDDQLRESMQVMTDGQKQDYLSWYNHLHEMMVPQTKDKEMIQNDIEFEMELVKQIQIDIDYILMLVQKYHDSHCKNKEIVLKIEKSIDASPDMRNKKELIMQFIDRMTPDSTHDIYTEWTHYVQQQKEQQLCEIIQQENLKDKETHEFMERAFADGYVTETGTAITHILPPMPLFGAAGLQRQIVKERVLEKLKNFFARFFRLG